MYFFFGGRGHTGLANVALQRTFSTEVDEGKDTKKTFSYLKHEMKLVRYFEEDQNRLVN